MGLDIGYCNGCGNQYDRCDCHVVRSMEKAIFPVANTFDAWWEEYVSSKKHKHSDEVVAWQEKGCLGRCPQVELEGGKFFAKVVWEAAEKAFVRSKEN